MKSLLVGIGICASLFPFAPVESREPEPLRCEVYEYPRTCRIIENNNFLIIKTYSPKRFTRQTHESYTLSKNADGTFIDAEDGAVWKKKTSSMLTTYYATKCSVFRGAKQCIPFEIKVWNK